MDSVCFTSTLFRVEPGEDTETNPHRYGKQLANWLGDKLRVSGYNSAEVIPEDWGWCVMCSREPVLLWIGCGNSETMEMLEDPALFGTQPIIWQCFVGSDVPLLKRLFARVDPKPLEQKLNTVLADLLSSDPNIHMVECP